MKKILIIEDDQLVANIYRNKLSLENFQVEVAHDGEAGLMMVSSFRPDIVLLDLMLPKLSGIEIMKKVRADADFQQLPIIVFSNTYLTNMVQEAWKAGATKCLSKASCTPKHVIDAVRSTLGGNGTPASVAPKAATAAPAAPRPSAATVADTAFQTDLRKSFVTSLPATIATLRALVQKTIKAENAQARVKELQEFYRRVHALTGNAAVTGMPQIAQMADALEALLKELYEKPETINASTLRTVATAIDFLGLLFDRPDVAAEELGAVNVLVVDDEAISRRAINYALDKAKLKSVNVEDPLMAFNLLSERKFNLIILDIGMPNMNGFELCSKIRLLPAHKKTPIVFVTSLNDFESRANSTMSGGNDFIAKPFLFTELAVKSLLYVMRSRLETTPKK